MPSHRPLTRAIALVIQAKENLTLAAGQNLAALTNEYHYEYARGGDSERHDIVNRLTQQSATVTGNNVSLLSGDDITLVSSPAGWNETKWNPSFKRYREFKTLGLRYASSQPTRSTTT